MEVASVAAETGIDLEVYDLSFSKGVMAFGDGRYEATDAMKTPNSS
jgi:hypothetical protein